MSSSRLTQAQRRALVENCSNRSGRGVAKAWKVAQAQTIAHFRGWSPLIAIQLEYSLIERTVEGELIPMAQDFGLGVMPWSSLKNGWLSGKYTRENAGSFASDRGPMVGTPTERDYLIIDVLLDVARELDANPAAVALA